MKGCLRETIHHMGRRCLRWDYGARCIYMVTICLQERGRPTLGTLSCASPETAGASVSPTALGEKVLLCWRRIRDFWPQVSLVGCQLMPDHFHGVLFVREQLPPGKTLGDIVRGFKTGCRDVGWAEGYVDTILFGEGQLHRMLAYMADNPRRLAEKHAHPDVFRVVRRLEVRWRGGENPAVSGRAQDGAVSGRAQDGAVSGRAQDGAVSGRARDGGVSGRARDGAVSGRARDAGWFAALGNRHLLECPVLLQVQCSRSLFAYERVRLPGGGWKILRDGDSVPRVAFTSDAFERMADEMVAATKHGAVLVSPCLSHGEQEIARRAFEAGGRVVALRLKGFAPLQKPQGKMFDSCAEGRLLLLAPAAWPWVPGEVAPTREKALVLNRIAQLLCGEGAAEIAYRGVAPEGIEEMARRAVNPAVSGRAQDGAVSGRAQDGAVSGPSAPFSLAPPARATL